jgi:tRNA (cytidine/uridine-2'-O-)-methyltransferase
MSRTRSEHDTDGSASAERSEPPARGEGQPAPGEGQPATGEEPTGLEPPPTAHVVLYQPEIPQNTGNIGRTCVAVGAKLWIVRPAAFRLDDARLRRAGLDYWEHLRWSDARNWPDLTRQLEGRRFFYFSRFAKRSIWDTRFQRGDVFVFGRESSGLPESILDTDSPHAIRLPMSPHVRSLNLATTVGIVLYEQARQTEADVTPIRNGV